MEAGTARTLRAYAEYVLNEGLATPSIRTYTERLRSSSKPAMRGVGIQTGHRRGGTVTSAPAASTGSRCTKPDTLMRLCCERPESPIHVVSQRLRHSTVAFTLHQYAHILPEQSREAETRLAEMVDS